MMRMSTPRWSMCVAKLNAVTYQHTAHQLGPARIAYRFHPFFDRDVVVIRRVNRQQQPAVMVRIEPELRIVIPCWMLDGGFLPGIGTQGPTADRHCGADAAERAY